MKIFLILVLNCLFCSLAFAQGPVTNKSPQFIVHLLDYLAKDYGGAVQNKKVLSQSEYNEQIEFSDTTLQLGQTLSEFKDHQDIISNLEKLNSLIKNRDDAEKVEILARAIQADVIKVAQLNLAPPIWPSLNEGKVLYAQSCVACHGQLGRGNGPAGVNLDPKPANFLDQEKMKTTSPFQAFNTIRLGVPGTAMAPFSSLSDKEVWSLAFYVISLRHEKERKEAPSNLMADPEFLTKVASSSDDMLREAFEGNDPDKKKKFISYVRTFENQTGPAHYIGIAKANLTKANQFYRSNKFDDAKSMALQAYLAGVEPIEPRIRANDSALVSRLELKMAAVRSAIDARSSNADVSLKIENALSELSVVEKVLSEKELSPWFSFIAAFTIVLREGFEAVLIILALLGVIRATGAKGAGAWVHGGWITALLCGGIAWVFSGFLIGLSGSSREMIEGITSLLAVFILLFVGFWLHRQTGIKRWKEFLDKKVRAALEDKNLLGLATISFVAAFREAIETVLFLRTLWMEGGSPTKVALWSGVFSSLTLVILLSWLALNFSKKIPVRRMFQISSVLMTFLALVLAGKGFHSLQESGFISVTSSPINLSFDFFGFYPTIETLFAQIMIIGLVSGAWSFGKIRELKAERVCSN